MPAHAHAHHTPPPSTHQARQKKQKKSPDRIDIVLPNASHKNNKNTVLVFLVTLSMYKANKQVQLPQTITLSIYPFPTLTPDLRWTITTFDNAWPTVASHRFSSNG
jgi:hypothetical protein